MANLVPLYNRFCEGLRLAPDRDAGDRVPRTLRSGADGTDARLVQARRPSSNAGTFELYWQMAEEARVQQTRCEPRARLCVLPASAR